MPRLLIAPLLALAMLLAGCTGERLMPPPEGEQLDLASIPGMPEGVEPRFWGDLAAASAEVQLQQVRRQIAARVAAEGQVPNDGRYDVLALSGGGSDGAYGAGLLNGWSDRGGRPEFALVTGISVGALIAPFAFLGEDYDDELERLFTNTSTDDVVEINLFNAALGSALGLTDTAPLELTFDRILTADMVRRIADEHAKGRRLWIGTTFLDAQRPVIWDIGAIASSDFRDRRDLIKKILIASASIPGAFPPVMFPVEVDGKRYAEMHVDGSVTRQLFVYPANIKLNEQVDGGVPGIQLGTIYLVRNTKLAPAYEPVEPSLLRIAERSIYTLIKAAGLGDVETIERQAERDGWGLLRTSVPQDFDIREGDFFDPGYMRALYDVGYRRARDGVAWEVVFDPSAPVDPVIAAIVDEDS